MAKNIPPNLIPFPWFTWLNNFARHLIHTPLFGLSKNSCSSRSSCQYAHHNLWQSLIADYLLIQVNSYKFTNSISRFYYKILFIIKNYATGCTPNLINLKKLDYDTKRLQRLAT